MLLMSKITRNPSARNLGKPQSKTFNGRPASTEGKALFSHQNLVEGLKNVSYFKDVPEAVIEDTVSSGQILNFPVNSVIFREDEPAAGLYVLLKGQVNLYKTGIRGLVAIINIIKPVIMFNEVTVIDGDSNPVTSIAAKDSTIWQVSYEGFQLLLQRHSVVGVSLLKMMAARNRSMLRLYEDLIDRPVLARTAKVLLILSQNGQLPINRIHCPNSLIAALAATVPEAVSRSIKTLKTQGIIDCTRMQIITKKPDELIKWAMIDPIIWTAN